MSQWSRMTFNYMLWNNYMMFFLSFLHKWFYSSGDYWQCQLQFWQSWGLCQRDLGDSVWWLLGQWRCKCCVQTTRLFTIWYILFDCWPRLLWCFAQGLLLSKALMLRVSGHIMWSTSTAQAQKRHSVSVQLTTSLMSTRVITEEMPLCAAC